MVQELGEKQHKLNRNVPFLIKKLKICCVTYKNMCLNSNIIAKLPSLLKNVCFF